MSDIQRWTVSQSLHSDPDDNGAFVTYADHVAAVQLALDKCEDYWPQEDRTKLWRLAFAEGVKAARDAVDSVVDEVGWRSVARDAIDAIEVQP